MKRFKMPSILAFTALTLVACGGGGTSPATEEKPAEEIAIPEGVLHVEAESFSESSVEVEKSSTVLINDQNWLGFTLDIPETGRYRVHAKGGTTGDGTVWIEDYVGNKDDRTYDITGKMRFQSRELSEVWIDGSPLQAGSHAIRIHASGGPVELDWIRLEPMVLHQETPDTLVQGMEGEEWELVWSDEFDQDGLPDATKWSYNVGNWGWGNNELQYYTDGDLKNARVEDGNLIIQAHKDAEGDGWSSARLTTQGKTAFVYGKIEFRAKVPTGRGTWAAGWLLGDSYRDEVSWPYCGEIDVLECVGYEIDDETGDGVNHATCHTRAYYFKQGNQIGSEINVSNMDGAYHTYAVEWYPNEIRGTLDGEHYYTYDKTANELEWPFDNPQNIIVNLAIGGGWGGLKGLDENLDKPQYMLDYVRVYARK